MKGDTARIRQPRPGLRSAAATAIATLLVATAASGAPKEMTRDEIVAIGKTVPGFSYWWGGSKWSPGASAKGKCTPTTSSGCPSCTHSGSWGADCSGFVGKAWQVAVPKALDVAYHPYSTVHFTNNTTWWTKINRSSAQRADAFTYNTNGAGHIFLYEKGDPWGSVWAWECKGCTAGCVYNLRSVSSSYGARQRKLLVNPAPVCAPHCEGAVKVDAKCGKGDCSKYAATCANDSLGLRCISVFCPAKGAATTCLPDGQHATCKDGQVTSTQCAAGTVCTALGANKAQCVPPCPASCDDGNGCTDDSCGVATGACVHIANSKPCDAGVACTAGDACAATLCKAGGAKDCSDGDPCTIDSCDPATSACAHLAKTCDDGDACTADACDGETGICAHGAADCDDDNPCSVDACAGGVCGHTPAYGACDDEDDCTIGDRCVGTACVGNAIDCDDGLACTTDACDAATCSHVQVEGAPVPGCSGGRLVELGTCGEVIATLPACATGTTCFHGACVEEAEVTTDAGAGGLGVGPADGGGLIVTAAAPGAKNTPGCSAGPGGSPGELALLGLAMWGALLLWRRRRADRVA